MPLIGVCREGWQTPAHDALAPPAFVLGTAPRGAEQECFFEGVGGSVDSWTPGPKPFCHRHPTGPLPASPLAQSAGRVPLPALPLAVEGSMALDRPPLQADT